jgi:RNA polymerase sigma factor (sigma-70 family)
MADEKNKEDFCSTRVTLLMRVKDPDDEKSWEDFVFYYKKFIYIICRSMKLNHHDSEEIVQKVLLKLWEKLPEFEYQEGSRFRSWLYVFISNAVKEFYRSTARANERKEKAADLEHWKPSNSFNKEIEDKVEREWQNYISNVALENISSEFSDKVMDVFRKFNEGKPVKELSKELNLPTNTIYVYSQRVIKRLKKEISRLCHELN